MKKGFTLIEVLMAVTILGLSMGILLTSVSNCLAVVRRAQEYQAARWTLSLGEAEHPPASPEKPEDLVVEPVEYGNGLSYSRDVEEDADQDELFAVYDKVTWSHRGAEKAEEVVRYVFILGSSKDASGSTGGGLLKAPAAGSTPAASPAPSTRTPPAAAPQTTPARPPATVPGRSPGPAPTRPPGIVPGRPPGNVPTLPPNPWGSGAPGKAAQ